MESPVAGRAAGRNRLSGRISVETPSVETPASIHAFWFGTSADDATVAAGQSRLWWRKSADTDNRIRQRFEPCLRLAEERKLDHWAATPSGRLALILLTDQFSRNMYRDTPQAFAFDAMARTWCREGLQEEADKALRPIERAFFYMPLQHSESLEDQEQAVVLFQELASGVEEQCRPAFDGFADYALRHRDVIARFGRFPHRNRILGRDSSPEEAAFLLERGSSF